MNCFEFRNFCLVEPRSTDAGFRHHLAECPGCASFMERQEDIERALAKAIQIDVPPELTARIILRQTTQRFFPRRLAYAALILVGLVGIVAGVLWGPRTSGIEQLVMKHILDEPDHLMSQDVVPVARVTDVLARAGVTLRQDIGIVRFADLCPEGLGVHLVVAGHRGPVTVMIMPTKPVSARLELAGGGLIGAVMPAEVGSLAIVGLPGEPLDEHEQRVRAAISGIA